MRHCPTLASDERPLIAQSIQSDLCMSRQRGFYHKCHRCVYRGKSADFRIEVPLLDGVVEAQKDLMPEADGSEAPVPNEVQIDRVAPVAKPAGDRVSETLS